MSSRQTQCVIFDCDGTLVDSEVLCCQALVQVFEQFDGKLTLEESLAHFKGGKLADILLDTQSRLGLSISLDILEPLYRDEVQKLFHDHLQPMTGAKELIQFLSQNNIEFCVASNAPKDRIKQSLEMTGLLPSFNGKIFSAFDANSWKPEPDLLLYTAMNMGFRTKDCIYIDDTEKGVEAGVRSGIKTFKLCSKGIEANESNPKACNIYSLLELKEWISDTHHLQRAACSSSSAL